MPFPTVHLVDVDVCRPDKCPGCDPQEDCVLVTVSNKVTATGPPYLYINEDGGDLDRWQTGIALANWTTASEEPTSVLCLGDFILVTSNVAGAVYYTDDLGTTLVEHVEAGWTGTAPGPNSSDAIDQSFIVLVHDSGHISGSYDAGRSWEWLDDGHATGVTLNRVMIARDNPQVIYAIGVANTVVKTENGGQNWFTQTGPCAGDAITALWVKDQFHVLVANDDGEVFETSDGGESWLTQDSLPELPPGATVVIGQDMVGCGCDGLWLITGLTGGIDTTYHRIYRNVDGGASGRWYIPKEVKMPSYAPQGVACCDINTAIVVGGYGASGNAILVA